MNSIKIKEQAFLCNNGNRTVALDYRVLLNPTVMQPSEGELIYKTSIYGFCFN